MALFTRYSKLKEAACIRYKLIEGLLDFGLNVNFEKAMIAVSLHLPWRKKKEVTNTALKFHCTCLGMKSHVRNANRET